MQDYLHKWTSNPCKGGSLPFKFKSGRAAVLYEIISVADRQSPGGVFICPRKVKVVKTEKRKQFPFFKKRGKPGRVAGIERHFDASSLELHGESCVFKACGSLVNCLNIE